MKRNTLLLLCIILLPLYSMAQEHGYGHGNGGGKGDGRGNGRHDIMGEAGSALTIFSENGDRFYLMLNGVKQNTYPQTRVRIEGLPQVTNDVQVIFDDNITRAISKTITFLDPVDGKPINLAMKIVREPSGACLKFHKATPLERGYRAEQDEYVMEYGRDNNAPGQSNVNIPPPPPPAGPMPMDDRSFSDAVQAIQGASFDDSKLSTAKTIINSNYFTTDQVITMCNLFSFDNSKLAIAKYAYKKTLDNNAYYKVNSVFSFDSDKQALNEYVSKNR